MFKSKESKNTSFDTLIGASTVFEGNIKSDGIVRIDGKVFGDIEVNGDVFVGCGGEVTGNILATNIHLSGTLKGNISAPGVLRILSTARLYGDIAVHSLVTDEGCIFRGTCSMMDAPAEITVSEKPWEKASSKKAGSGGKDHKKSNVICDIYEERERSNQLKAE